MFCSIIKLFQLAQTLPFCAISGKYPANQGVTNFLPSGTVLENDEAQVPVCASRGVRDKALENFKPGGSVPAVNGETDD
jgi:hypothetical protein